MDLKNKKCVPCEGGIPPLNKFQIEAFLSLIDKRWVVVEGKRLVKEYHFVSFKHTISFVNKVAEKAEEEGHHPDIFISYARCRLEIWTHAIGGLSENDFILAAKIDTVG